MNRLTKLDTLAIKGLGIILMLWHHLFYNLDSLSLYNDFHIKGYGIVNQTGIFAKVCVALFVFISGYGLSASSVDLGIKSFYIRRLRNLYLPYWFVFVLFVPLGIFIFNHSLTDAYGNHIIIKLILDFFGSLYLFGIHGYNPTWWFYSCILVLYLLYPVFVYFLNKAPFTVWVFAVIVSIFSRFSFVRPISAYILPFISGIYLEKYRSECTLSTVEVFICLSFLCMCRNFSGGITFIVDTFICICVCMLIAEIKQNWFKNVLCELGRHSTNIFLFHTFIYYYWFKDYIYISRNPFLIFLSLLVVSYMISLVLELLKRKIGFYKLINDKYLK